MMKYGENKQPLSYTVEELRTFLLKRQSIPGNLYEVAERKVLLYPHDGDGGIIPTTTPLCLSSLITLMISPMGCGIHLTETGRGNLSNEGHAWLLRLSEKDLVLGMQEQRIMQAVEEILKNMNQSVDGILLCATCVDALLSTNLLMIAHRVEEIYHIRAGAEFMGPFLKESPKQADFRMMSGVYNLLRSEGEKKTIPAVNVFGILEQPICRAELSRLLQPLGIRYVFSIGDFSTLKEADIMTHAKLNIVMNGSALRAAQVVRDKWNIPYVIMNSSYDYNVIAQNYQHLAEALGGIIEDTAFGDKVCDLIRKLDVYIKGYRCGVGGKNDIPCFKAACDLMKLGCDVRVIFAHQIKQTDLPEISWLCERNPEIKVYFDSHPSMYEYKANPTEFNLSFGVPDPFVQRVDGILVAPLLSTGGTYSDIISFVEELTEVLINQNNTVETMYPVYQKCWSFELAKRREE